MTSAGTQSLSLLYPELSPMQGPSVSTTGFICSVINDYLNIEGDCSVIFVFVGGNNDNDGVTSDADNVYEWNGDEEHWTVHGTILERKYHVGVSLVPLSSGVLDHCN